MKSDSNEKEDDDEIDRKVRLHKHESLSQLNRKWEYNFNDKLSISRERAYSRNRRVANAEIISFSMAKREPAAAERRGKNLLEII